MDYRDVLRQNFKTLDLPDDAAEWLLDLWDVIQAFDDAADGTGHPVEAYTAAWAGLMKFPANPFYMSRILQIQPLIAVQIQKWRASDVVERAKKHDERSFCARAGYFDVVMGVCIMCFGTRFDPSQVMQMYGEKYADYQKEFADA